MLQPLLLCLERVLFLEKVEVGEDTEDVAWHAGGIEDIEEFHCLHFEAVVAVYHEQEDVDDFRDVDHACEGVGGTFYEGEAAALRSHDCEGTDGVREGLFGVSTD